MIEVIEFCKSYDATIAVERLSFSVEPGQVLALVGPNGAGKTTTLRALTGIIPASGGSLRVGGRDIEQDPIGVKRCTAYVPDDPQLFHDLTVDQHLAFTASVYDVQQPDELLEELLAMFQLQHKRNARAADLSRGMRQKLAICCAYLHQPQAILLDEPMTGLDPRGIRLLKESVRQRAASGAAVIISSHLLAMVEDICTHALVLNNGRQCFCGTTEELRQTYAEAEDDETLEDIFFRAIEDAEDELRQAACPAETATPTANEVESEVAVLPERQSLDV